MKTVKLIKSIVDLKDHVAINFVDDFEILAPFVVDRESWLLRKYLGTALFNKLAAVKLAADAEASDSGSGSSSSSVSESVTESVYEHVLWICQRIVANLTMKDYIPEGQLDISENGIRISTTGEKKQAFDWQIKNLEKRYQDTANSNLEDLISYLTANIKDIDEWTSSGIYAKLKSHFVNSALEFEKFYGIDESHLMFIKMLPDIEYVERTIILSLLGQAFYDELKERILDGEKEESSSGSGSDTTTLEMYQKVLDMLAGAVTLLTVQYSKEIDADKTDAERRAVHFMQQLSQYLDDNASETVFAAYFTGGKYTPKPTEDEIAADESLTSNGIDNSKLSGIYGAF